MSKGTDILTTAESEGQAEAKERELALTAAKKRIEGEAKEIAEDIKKHEGSALHRFLALGQRCWRYMEQARAAGYRDSDARSLLDSEIYAATGVHWIKEIGRSIKSYQANVYFGERILRLPLDAHKALGSLMVEDEKTGEWYPRSEIADGLKGLIRKATAGRKPMPSDVFRAELNKLVYPGGEGRAIRTPAKGASEEISPAGEKDLGPPPVLPRSLPPAATAIAMMETISRSENDADACNLLGQSLTAEQVSEVFSGLVTRLKGMEDRNQAADEWGHVWAVMERHLTTLQALFPAGTDRKRSA